MFIGLGGGTSEENWEESESCLLEADEESVWRRMEYWAVEY